jgi:hypothetical protein
MQRSINTNTQARSIVQGSGPESLASETHKETPGKESTISMKLTEASLSSDKEHNGSRNEASKERHKDKLVSSKKLKKIRKRKTTLALSYENAAIVCFRTYPSIMKPAASYHPVFSFYQRQAENKANLPPTAQDSCSTASPRITSALKNCSYKHSPTATAQESSSIASPFVVSKDCSYNNMLQDKRSSSKESRAKSTYWGASRRGKQTGFILLVILSVFGVVQGLTDCQIMKDWLPKLFSGEGTACCSQAGLNCIDDRISVM